jgi:hypothetical protein
MSRESKSACREGQALVREGWLIRVSVLEGEASAEVLGDALVEATGCGCRSETDRCGAAGQDSANDGRAVRKFREEHPRPPLLVDLPRALGREIECE